MDRDGCRRAWLDLAPRKHRDRHGPMGPDDSSATLMIDGQQEIGGGGGGGDGGAAEEMDRDESAPTPDGWWKMTRDQKRRFRQNQKKRQGKVV